VGYHKVSKEEGGEENKNKGNNNRNKT